MCAGVWPRGSAPEVLALGLSVVGLGITGEKYTRLGKTPTWDSTGEGAESRFWGVTLNSEDECLVGRIIKGRSPDRGGGTKSEAARDWGEVPLTVRLGS